MRSRRGPRRDRRSRRSVTCRRARSLTSDDAAGSESSVRPGPRATGGRDGRDDRGADVHADHDRPFSPFGGTPEPGAHAAGGPIGSIRATALVLHREHRVIGGHVLEGVERSASRRRDVGAGARNRVHVAAQDRGPLRHRHLPQPAATPPAPAQHRSAPCRTHVLHPRALPQHRHQVPTTVDIGHAERESTDLSAPVTGNLEGDPPAGQNAELEHPGPEPGQSPGGAVGPPRRVHVPSPLVGDRLPSHAPS